MNTITTKTRNGVDEIMDACPFLAEGCLLALRIERFLCGGRMPPVHAKIPDMLE